MVRLEDGHWHCVDCKQVFDEWPSDFEACPGPVVTLLSPSKK
jgi:hypothetical protein